MRKSAFDTDSTEGELLLGYVCAVAQEESFVNYFQNLRWGIRKRMESGTYRTSSVPYGYKQVNYDLVPAPNQIEIVKDIFNAFLQGESTTKIADDLNRLRPDADKHWHHTTIERILQKTKSTPDVPSIKRVIHPMTCPLSAPKITVKSFPTTHRTPTTASYPKQTLIKRKHSCSSKA